MLEGVLAPAAPRPEAIVPGYKLAGKTGTAQKPDKQGGYSKNKFVASFVGFAPGPQPAPAGGRDGRRAEGRHLRRLGGGAGVPEDRLVRAAVPWNPAELSYCARAVLGCMTACCSAS